MVDLQQLEADGGQRNVTLSDGSQVTGSGSIVIMGPNGSGKTRESRRLISDVGIDVVNALRNTRMNSQLPAMATNEAKQNYQSQKNNVITQPYEQANDFEYMLTSLIAEASDISLKHMRQLRNGEADGLPPLTPLEEMQELWSQFFPGRTLTFDGYAPKVHNTVVGAGQPQTYSAQTMSDGEKAALYLAGRALTTEYRSVMLIDEPETHFHSLLANRFWDAIETARPDIRMIYVTHDIHFAASRKTAAFLIADPGKGLVKTDVGRIPDDVASVILGTATLSFTASNIIFCEGEEQSLDNKLLSAWYADLQTVVQPVGSCDMVHRCVSALSNSGLVQNLTVSGLIDRDFHPDSYVDALGDQMKVLGVHEIEGLYSHPGVVKAVARFLGQAGWNEADFEVTVRSSFSDTHRHKVVLERWKRRIEGQLIGVVAAVKTRQESLEDISLSLPDIFDQAKWSFSPQDMLNEEKSRIEALAEPSSSLDELLKIMPAKGLLPIAADAVGMSKEAYVALIVSALNGQDANQQALGNEIRSALDPYLPRF